MKILFMGSAAGEGIPAPFCPCPACEYARKTGGKELRTRTGALIDGTLKIDYCMDTFSQALRYGLSFAELHSILVTHSHGDHLMTCDLSRNPTNAHLPEDAPVLTIYGNAAVGRVVEEVLSDEIAFRPVTAFRPIQVEGYRVTPLEAVHCTSNRPGAAWPVMFDGVSYNRSEETLIYLIEKDGKSLLYAHDTDELTPDNLAYLAGKKLDLVSLDCTNGGGHYDYVGHMGADDNLKVRERMLANGAADAHTVFVANHFSHNGIRPYEEMQRLMPGFVIAYDGLEIEI